MSDLAALRLVAQRFPDKADRICELPSDETAADDFLDGSLATRSLGLTYRAPADTFIDMAAELLGVDGSASDKAVRSEL